MTTLIFYGASDDLVEVDGDTREEYSLPTQDVLRLVLDDDKGNRTAIYVRYEQTGIWTVCGGPTEEDIPTVPGTYELSVPPAHVDWAKEAKVPAYSVALRVVTEHGVTVDLPEGTTEDQ